MTIIFDILFIILGVWCVLKGADYLTEGAAAVARRMHIPEMIIGLTIVAAGTSAPELFVSVVSALKGEYYVDSGCCCYGGSDEYQQEHR